MDGPLELTCGAASSGAEPRAAGRGPGRLALAAAARQLAVATAALEGEQRRAERLAAVIAEARRLETELAALRAADAAGLGAWLAGDGNNPRPPLNPGVPAIETRLAAMAKDADAARAALPAAEGAFQRSAAEVRDLQQQRDSALCAAAVEAAQPVAERYRAALAAALEQEARLRGLRDELLLWGNRADAPAGALAAAARINELVAGARTLAAVPRNPTAARVLIEALVTDPDATL